MNWGTKITIAFILFVAFIATLVTVCMKQDVFLVAPDYYEQELDYQSRINSIQNYENLSKKVELSLTKNDVVLTFPEDALYESGTIWFYRPSQPNLDTKVPLSLRNQQQLFPRKGFISGFWKTKISWISNGQSFFFEENIVL